MAGLFEVVKCHCLEGVTGNSVSDGKKIATKLGRASPKDEDSFPEENPHDEKDKLIEELKRQLQAKETEMEEIREQERSDTRSDGAESEAESTSSCDDDDTAPHFVKGTKGAVQHVFATLQSSALGWQGKFALPAQILLYSGALGGVLFVLIAHSFPWGKPEHRRLQVNRITRTPTVYEPNLVGMRLEDLRMDEPYWDSLDWMSSMSDYFTSSTASFDRRLNDGDHEDGSHASDGGHDGAHDTHDSGNHDESGGHGGAHDSGDHESGSVDGHDGAHEVEPGDVNGEGGDENGGHGHNGGGHTDDPGHAEGSHSGSHGDAYRDGHGTNQTGGLGEHGGDHGDEHGDGHGDGHDGGGHQLIVNIAYCTVSAGLIALIINLAKQPLLLGYILGGLLVGPIGLKLIESAEAINTISELGLILLLFMIGLELDVSELLKMGKVVILTGLLQFPICAIVHVVLFMVINAIGISFGEGDYSVMYMAVCCGISSTMIVVKLLSEKMETDSAAGRLTIGVLIFQDMWAIIVMAIQPNLADINPLEIMLTFCMMAALLIIAFAYSKYVLPAVFFQASESMELLLVLSLSWCFFICCIALLPAFNLSMELAALIAGVAMATFPYSAELNGKVKYIRDYFITLYFCSLGMQIPPLSIAPILKALLVCILVLLVRWVGLYLVIGTIDGFNYSDNRLAVVATMNLSEVSEFGLVLCSIGKGLGHVELDTFEIMIWVFSILAVGASYFIKFNHAAYNVISRGFAKCSGRELATEAVEDGHHDGHEHDIVFLGYSRTASALVSDVRDRCPQLKKRLHVICQHGNAKKMKKLREKEVSCSFADIGAPDVLEHAMPHGEYPIQLVIITQTNDELKGYTNKELMLAVQKLARCKDSKFICTASSGSTELYEAGAGYVLKPAQLQAAKLADMLIGYVSNVGDDAFAADYKAATVQGMFQEQLDSDSRRGNRTSLISNEDDEGVGGGRAKKAHV